MRVGLLAQPFKEEIGGGYTYVEMVMQGAKRVDLGAEPVILDYDSIFHVHGLRRLGSLASSRWRSRSVDMGIRYKNSSEEVHSQLLNAQLESQGIDLLWIVSPVGVVYPSIPYAITVWDIAHRYFPFFPEVSTQRWPWEHREHYYASMLPRASYVFIGNQRGADEIHECYQIPHERIRTIALPAPNMLGETGAASLLQKPFLLYPAQFWAHKNHRNAIAALNILRREYGIDIDLVFAGSDQGNVDYVKQLVADAGLSDHIHFVGFVDRATLESLYRAAKGLLYVSLFGPDNLPPLEAFSCGCPVIASDHRGHREQLTDAAIFVDPLDPEAIAQGVRALFDDTALRERLIANGRMIAASRGIDSYLAKVRDIFCEFSRYRQNWPPSRPTPTQHLST